MIVFFTVICAENVELFCIMPYCKHVAFYRTKCAIFYTHQILWQWKSFLILNYLYLIFDNFFYWAAIEWTGWIQLFNYIHLLSCLCNWFTFCKGCKSYMYISKVLIRTCAKWHSHHKCFFLHANLCTRVAVCIAAM